MNSVSRSLQRFRVENSPVLFIFLDPQPHTPRGQSHNKDRQRGNRPRHLDGSVGTANHPVALERLRRINDDYARADDMRRLLAP